MSAAVLSPVATALRCAAAVAGPSLRPASRPTAVDTGRDARSTALHRSEAPSPAHRAAPLPCSTSAQTIPSRSPARCLWQLGLTNMPVPAGHVQRRVAAVVAGGRRRVPAVRVRKRLHVLEVAKARAQHQVFELVGCWRHGVWVCVMECERGNRENICWVATVRQVTWVIGGCLFPPPM